jgi:hypothetical protein
MSRPGALGALLTRLARRRLLHVSQLGLAGRIVRVNEHADGRSLGNKLMQQPQSFCLQLIGKEGNPSDISPRPIKAGD